MNIPIDGNYANNNKTSIEENGNLPKEYMGRWGGTGGGLIDLKERVVRDVLQNHDYSYSILKLEKKTDDNQFVLRLDKPPTKSFIKQVMVITFKSNDHFIYYGFDSIEKYERNEFSGAGEFFQDQMTRKEQ